MYAMAHAQDNSRSKGNQICFERLTSTGQGMKQAQVKI